MMGCGWHAGELAGDGLLLLLLRFGEDEEDEEEVDILLLMGLSRRAWLVDTPLATLVKSASAGAVAPVCRRIFLVVE